MNRLRYRKRHSRAYRRGELRKASRTPIKIIDAQGRWNARFRDAYLQVA